VPELLLFHKATAYFGTKDGEDRPQDEADFRALLPKLAEPERQWLREAVLTLQPSHPWLR
jgi:hypothetical protein